MRRVPTNTFLRLFAIASLMWLVPLASAAPGGQTETAAPSASAAWTAQIMRPIAVRSAPRNGARVVARVDTYTDFWRRPERLMVLSPVQVDPATNRGWVLVRLPKRPNGAKGFVPLDAVTLRKTRTRIVVRLRARTVEVWRSGRRTARFSAVVGTGSTPTPKGLFAVQDPVPSASWQRSYLGPYIITLTAYSPVLRSFMGGNGLVAIHGTNAPGLLGTAASHGCVRVSNDAVRRLYKLSTPGTPVEIRR